MDDQRPATPADRTPPPSPSPTPSDPLPPARMKDPGGRRSRIIALLGAFLCGGAVIAMQNAPALLGEGPVEPPPVQEELIEQAADGQPAETEPTDADPGEASAEQPTPGGVAEAEAEPAVQPPGGTQLDIMIQLFIRLSEFEVIGNDPSAIPQLEKVAQTREDRVRVAIAAGEFAGTEAAIERLETIRAGLGSGPLATDVDLLLRLYRDGPSALTEQERQRLERHHGFVGRVALTHPLPEGDPARTELRSGGARVAVAILGFGVLMATALVSGLILFVVAIVKITRGTVRSRMPRPAPGGSVYLESFALFVGGFLLVHLLAGVVGAVFAQGPNNEPPDWVVVFSLLLQWSLLITPFWPLLRGRLFPGLEGMDWQRFSGTIGLHRGRGFFREVGAGIVGYLAGLPVFIAGVALSLTLLAIYTLVTGGDEVTPRNPLFEMLADANPWVLALIVSLATIWAPLCEETIFRGSLFRHLRARYRLLGSALLSAAVFAFMHAYGPLLAFPVLALGFNFAMIREWRGSLIGPIAAHMLHNGTLMVLFIIVLSSLDLT